MCDRRIEVIVRRGGEADLRPGKFLALNWTDVDFRIIVGMRAAATERSAPREGDEVDSVRGRRGARHGGESSEQGKVGTRIRQLRQERGLTAEKLVFESEVGSRGYLSDVEAGRALPSLHVLERLATYLGVGLLDLVTFPDDDLRQRYVDQTRSFSTGALRRLLREAEVAAPTKEVPPKRTAVTIRSDVRPRTRPLQVAARGARIGDATRDTEATSTTRRLSVPTT